MANINDYVYYENVGTNTPGVSRQVLRVKPEAPPEVHAAAEQARQQSAGFGGNLNEMVVLQNILGNDWVPSTQQPAYAPVNENTAAGGTADFNQLVDSGQSTADPETYVPPTPTPTAAPVQPAAQTSPPAAPTLTGITNQQTLTPLTSTQTSSTTPVGPVQSTGAQPAVAAPAVAQPAVDFNALIQPNVTAPTATAPTLTSPTATTPTLTPPAVSTPTVTPPATTTQPPLTPGSGSPSLLQQLQANPQFASLPPAWQQEIATQAQQNGLQWALTANSQWASENPNDPNAAALSQWATTQAPIQTTGAATPPAVNVPGANYNMQEAGNQQGSYASQGQTNQTQQGQQATNTAQNQVGSQQSTSQQATTGQQSSVNNTATTSAENQAQTTSGTQTGQQASTGATTGETTVTTPFDIASLVESQLPGIQATDANRSAFLTDFMNTGGTALGSQVDQAVRNSLTGPQMTGAGDSARARAAGYAGAQIARTNADQRLQAANQLAGPTGLGTMTNAVQSLYGQKTAGTQTGNVNTTGTNTGVTNTNTTGATNQNSTGLVNTASNTLGQENTQSAQQTAGATNTVDFQSLVGNESQAGTATGSSGSTGSGVVPSGQAVKTGGCVVCTAYSSLGLMHPGAIRRAVTWKLAQPRYAMAVEGYMLYGPTLARWVMKKSTFAWLFRPVAREILYHECHLSHPRRLRKRWIALVLHEFFDCLSKPVGFFSRMLGLNTGVRCSKVRALLESQNLSFKL